MLPIIATVQFHVVTYMDNTIPGVNPATQRSGRPIKSISQVRPSSRLAQQLCTAFGCLIYIGRSIAMFASCMLCACEVAVLRVLR
jgi:hypothetical protein